MEITQRAEDRAAIIEVKARYFRYVDTKQWERLKGEFTADAVFENTRVPYRDASEFADITGEWFGDAISSHIGGTPEIVFTGEDTARAIWPMRDRVEWRTERPVDSTAGNYAATMGPWGFTGEGYYEEGYRRVDGAWKISRWCLKRLRVEPRLAPSGGIAPPDGGLAASEGDEWLAGTD